MTITNDKGRLTEEQIQKMVKEAEEFAEQDEEVRKRIEALNSIQNFIATTKTTINDKEGLGGKLDSDDKKKIQDALKESENWLEENNAKAEAADIEEQLSELQAQIAPITAKIYGESAGGAGAEAGGAPKDDDELNWGAGGHDEL